MSDPICIKATLDGTVQGVFFRKNALKKANQHKLTGWVKNQKDGSVELVVCGASEDIALFNEWIQAGGPPAAEINVFHWDEIPFEPFDSFEIR
ncbi:MAG: acylphosphatase [Gammaproteobacteria bacterium]|nr:acylphosphatase [Gammaproteobacteria bacterium]MCH9744979.1 acylphosphatase [Gammaproteobacteria bacterium]